MGASAKYFCIYDNNVYEIPLKQINAWKVTREELSNQTVLLVDIIYETRDRKPYKVWAIHFDKITFDSNGVYDIKKTFSSDEYTKEYLVSLNYMNYELKFDKKKPLPIPKAPTIPTKEEILVIKEYLNRKYPLLLINSPDAIENNILSYKELHEDKIRKMKESHKIARR